jgi:uncharacterized membrane protein YhiD involved in acid resistance
MNRPLWSTDGQLELLLPALLAPVLSAQIGVEREVRAKSAGVRTHTLVGLGAAVFILVSTEEGDGVATVLLQVAGRGDLPELAAELAQLPGVRTARTGAEDFLEEQ